MIEIVEGSLDESKQEMKNTIAVLKREVSKFKQTVKLKNRTKEQKQAIKKHEAFAHFFRVSQMQPVYIESLCFNYILYNRFMKKLKGFQVSETIETDPIGIQKLVISYHNKASKGRFELYDISHELEGLTFFPRAVIVDE